MMIKKTFCPKCREKGLDTSGDNLVLYQNGGAHCFVKDTRVITSEGVLPISELLQSPCKIINGKQELEKVQFKSYGIKQIYNLYLKNNDYFKKIQTTSDHLWFVEGKDNCIKTKDLTSGDTLVSFKESKWVVEIVKETNHHEEVYCCETSTQSFLLEDYILTHNCFSCGYTIPSDDLKSDKVYESTKEESRLEYGKKEWDALKTYTKFEGIIKDSEGKEVDYRGITPETYKSFGVRHEYSVGSGELIKQYYPLTSKVDGESQICGVKFRSLPKTFRAIGQNKASTTELFGQALFEKSGKKTVVLASGECFPPYVEVMTDRGFTRFDELTKNHKILQVGHLSYLANFVQPTAFIKKPYDGLLVEYTVKGRYHIIGTPDHEVPVFNNKNTRMKGKKVTLEEGFPDLMFIGLTCSLNAPMQHHSRGLEQDPENHKKVPFSNTELRLITCLVWDMYERKAYSNKEKTLTLESQNSKLINTVTFCLNSLKIDFERTMSLNNSFVHTYTISFKVPEWLREVCLKERFSRIPRRIINEGSISQKRRVLKVLHFISNSNTEIRSNNLDLLKDVQELYATSNTFSKIVQSEARMYNYVIADKELNTIQGRSVTRFKKTVPYKGYVYCVTVPSGQILIRSNGYVSVAGNCDAMAAFQMLKGLGQNSPAVVSSTIGEKGFAQYQANYEFFDKFEKIVIIPDQDKPGRDALKDAIQVLPRNKVYVVELPQKDTNDMLINNLESEFINRYLKAKPYVPDGVLGSGELYTRVLDTLDTVKVPLPKFLHRLEDMFPGGFALESIINLVAASGIGKSSFINEIVYDWIFSSPYKIGILSLELSAGQYGQALLSRHLSVKIANMPQEEAKEYLTKDNIIDKSEELFKTEDGSDRFFLIDERSNDLETVKKLIEQMIIGCGCKVVVIDPLQDLFSGGSLADEQAFMAWQKVMIKTYGSLIVNICHTRKSANSKDSGSTGNMITEEDIAGASDVFKSASVNILFTRNKLSEDPIERNTTKVYISKNRWSGYTGPGPDLYYNNFEHRIVDLEDYKLERPDLFSQELPEDY